MEIASRLNTLTIGAIAVVAYALCDEAHEVLGHGLAALLTPDVHWVTLSTMALSTQGGSRLIAASGPLINLLLGLIALVCFRRRQLFDATSFFLWLFGTINLLNATGYLAYSGVLDFGDWAQVIVGWNPHLVWRIVLVVTGAAGYSLTLRHAATALAARVHDGLLARQDVARMMLTSYLYGGVLLSAGAALNPLGLKMAMLTGVAGSFGAMLGLLLVTPLVERKTQPVPSGEAIRPPNIGWLMAAAFVVVIFIGVLGPGIHFRA